MASDVLRQMTAVAAMASEINSRGKPVQPAIWKELDKLVLEARALLSGSSGKKGVQ